MKFILSLLGLSLSLNAFAADTTRATSFNPYRPVKYGPDARSIDYVNPDAPKGGKIQLYTDESFDSLNAMNWGVHARDNAAPALQDVMFGSLMRNGRDRDYSAYAYIAQEIEWANDFSFVIFHINPAARFSNGEPITAEDVLYSYNSMKDTHPYFRMSWASVSAASIPAPLQVRFDLRHAKNTMAAKMTISTLGEMMVFNKKFLELHPSETWGRDGIIPVGSGPYVVESFVPYERVVYKRLPNFWAKDIFIMRGQFNFDRITYTSYRDRSIARLAAWNGTLDFWTEDNLSEFDAFVRSPGLSLRTEVLSVPRIEVMRGINLNSLRPIFQNARVRKAISLAFNFKEINNLLFRGSRTEIRSAFPHAELSYQPVMSSEEQSVLGALPNIDQAIFQPEVLSTEVDQRKRLFEAMQLLNAAGWHLQGTHLVDKSGRPFSFLIYYYRESDEPNLYMFQAELRRLGIEVTLRRLELLAFISTLKTGDYDARVFGYQFSSIPEPTDLKLTFGSEDARNYENEDSLRIEDSNIDTVIHLYDKTESLAERIVLGRALDRLVISGNYMIPLGMEEHNRLVFKRWLHHEATVSPRSGTSIIETWWAE